MFTAGQGRPLLCCMLCIAAAGLSLATPVRQTWATPVSQQFLSSFRRLSLSQEDSSSSRPEDSQQLGPRADRLSTRQVGSTPRAALRKSLAGSRSTALCRQVLQRESGRPSGCSPSPTSAGPLGVRWTSLSSWAIPSWTRSMARTTGGESAVATRSRCREGAIDLKVLHTTGRRASTSTRWSGRRRPSLFLSTAKSISPERPMRLEAGRAQPITSF